MCDQSLGSFYSQLFHSIVDNMINYSDRPIVFLIREKNSVDTRGDRETIVVKLDPLVFT